MRAVFTNAGSTGDILPFLALAAEMRKYGHQTVFAGLPSMEGLVARSGFDFTPVGHDLDLHAIQREVVRQWSLHGDLKAVVRATCDVYLPLLESYLPQTYESLKRVCEQADVLISGALQPAARMIHELIRIPFVSVQLTHFAGRDSEAARQMLAEPVNKFRAQFRLPPLEDPWRTDANSPQLALYAMSRFIRKPDADWPPHHHVVGFFFMEEAQWQPPASLAAFMEAGEKPIAITFGSISYDDVGAVTGKLLGAVEKAGCRAVIQHGWSGLAKDVPLPREVMAVDYVPHHWLFEHAAAVVHHGGAGTTAAVWRAGVPAVIVPHVNDQEVWAELAFGLGLMPAPIAIADLTADRLAEALRAVLDRPDYARKARHFRGQIRSEGGASQARELIEALVRRRGCFEPATVDTPGPEARAARRKSFLKRKQTRMRV